MGMELYSLGCRMPVSDWVRLNRDGIFEDPDLRRYVSPFPPVELMHIVSGLRDERDFASHGADLYLALSEAAPKPLAEYEHLLDFGCGSGRLARMFKGHPHRVSGCDIDRRHVQWINGNLNPIRATLTSVRPPLPFASDEFDGIIGISVFTHLNEAGQDAFLAELCRICRPGGTLFLTVHGARALERAVAERSVREMLTVDEERFQGARSEFDAGRHAFILQEGHLTTVRKKRSLFDRFRRALIGEPFEYGITFIPEEYLHTRWGRWFTVVDYRHGAIHDFQDIIVLTPKKDPQVP